MLPFFRKAKPEIELTTFDEGVVGFRCEVPLVVGQRLQARCKLPDGEEFDGTVLVNAVGETHKGVIEKPPEINKHLGVLLPPSFVERRSVLRLPKSLRVLSRRVQGYKCSTTDISPVGVGLILDGPPMLGDHYDLEIDADMPGIRSLNVEVEVLWDLPPDANRKSRCGARFISMSNLQKRTLEKMLAHVGSLIRQ